MVEDPKESANRSSDSAIFHHFFGTHLWVNRPKEEKKGIFQENHKTD